MKSQAESATRGRGKSSPGCESNARQFLQNCYTKMKLVSFNGGNRTDAYEAELSACLTSVAVFAAPAAFAAAPVRPARLVRHTTTPLTSAEVSWCEDV